MKSDFRADFRKAFLKKHKREKIIKDRKDKGTEADIDRSILRSGEESRIKREEKANKKHRKRELAIPKGYMQGVPLQRIHPVQRTFHHDDNNSENRFVIVSACHNKKSYIDDAIESVVSQDYRPIQLVMIDDCSTDGTGRRLVKRASYIISKGISYSVIQSTERLYCSSAYSTAVGYASGKYFGILDADDMLNVGAMSTVAKIYEQYPNVAYIWTQHIVCSPTMEKEKIGISKAPPPGVGMLEFGHNHSFSHWRTFSNRINKSQVFCNGLRSAVDKYMGYRLEELGVGMFVNKQCYLYRTSIKNSITGQERTKKSWDKVAKAAESRRAKNKSTPFPILIYEG
jgi:glycosyltransferase involved in cell wall biosynthesis